MLDRLLSCTPLPHYRLWPWSDDSGDVELLFFAGHVDKQQYTVLDGVPDGLEQMLLSICIYMECRVCVPCIYVWFVFFAGNKGIT